MLPNNLGDVIMALPVLRALKTGIPECHITFLVEAGYEGGLVNNAWCDRILPIPRKAIKSAVMSDTWQEAPGLLRTMIDEVKAPAVSLAINLSQHQYLSYIATLTGAKEVRGRHFLREGNHALDDPWSQYLYAIPFARACNALHATDVYCRIAGVAFTDNGDKSITITPNEIEWGTAYLTKHGCTDGRKIAMLQPGAAYASKRWPREYFVSLGKKLADDGYRIVITGALAERAIAVAIAQSIGAGCLVPAGELSFRKRLSFAAFRNWSYAGIPRSCMPPRR